MKASHTSIVMVAGVLGAALGLGAYTFAYARGWSYLTDNPRACANCHIMNEQYDGWIKSSHRAVAVCNDCHVPHSFVAKYATKAQQRLLALLLLHIRHFPRTHPGVTGESGHRGGELPPLPRARRPEPWGRLPTPDLPTSRVSGATAPSATWNFPRPTSPILRGEPCLNRNEAASVAGVAVLC